MAFKVFLLVAFVAVARGGIVAPVAHVAVAANLADSEYDPHPQYSYAYDVQDTVTGDFKSQFESRQGDVVQGRYSVLDPDGTKRVVDYTADPVHGFNAVVSRAPIVAPIAARVVAPLHARALAPAPLLHQHPAALVAHQHVAPLVAHQRVAPLLAHPHAVAHQHAAPLVAHQHAAPLLAHQYAAPFLGHQHSAPLVHAPGVHSHSQFARFAAPLAYPAHAAPFVV